MDKLSFDAVKVNTPLAEDYIKTKTISKQLAKGKAWDYKQNTEINIDDCSVTINDEPKTASYSKKLRDLASKVTAMAELFCQLEYMMRKTDGEDTKNALTVLMQCLKMENAWRQNLKDFDFTAWTILIKESTPLYYLGFMAYHLRCDFIPTITCTAKTAPMCQLFWELAKDVGLDIKFYQVNEEDAEEFPYAVFPEPISEGGCTAVITEVADMDSAIDAVLNSSIQAPWKIERVFVQESVYQEFLDSLKGRCENIPSDKCEAMYQTPRLTIQCGIYSEETGKINVQAYRSTKELLSLLPKGAFLSLWCSETTTAHEIAINADYDIVWIDSYADFDGPTRSCIPFYNFTVETRYLPEKDLSKLLEMQIMWITKSIEERKSIIIDVLETYDGSAEVIDELSKWNCHDSLEISNNKMTIISDRPTVVFFENDELLSDVLKLSIRGHGVALIYEKLYRLIQNLSDVGIPVLTVGDCPRYVENNFSSLVEVKPFDGNYKVIHSRFGTIFAN